MAWRRAALQLASGLAAVLAATLLLFFSMEKMGDPLAALLPPDAPAAVRAALADQLGLNRPLPVRLVRYLGRMLMGDFGNSYRLERPALPVVLQSYPATLLLAAWAVPTGLGSGLLLGLALTWLGGGSRHRRIGHGGAFLALLVQAMPGFVVAILAIQVLTVRWRLFPPSGLEGWRSLVMPGTLLGLGLGTRLGLLLQDRLRVILREPYVLFARAKGLSEGLLYRRHLLRPALSLVLSYGSLQFGYLLGGALTIETIFGYPGIGRLAVTALATRDLPLLQACVFVSGLSFLAVRTGADLIHRQIDPRLGEVRSP